MILDVKDLHHSFGEVNAINKLSFSIEHNSIVSILGPSGCGKTTLIRLIAGLEEIQKGQISFEGKLVANEKFNTPRAKINLLRFSRLCIISSYERKRKY